MDYIKITTICPLHSCEFQSSVYVIPSVKANDIMQCPKCGIKTKISDKSIIALRNASRKSDFRDDTVYDMVNLVKVGCDPDVLQKIASQYVLNYGWFYDYAMSYAEQQFNKDAYYQVDLIKHIPRPIDTSMLDENSAEFIYRHGYTPFNCGNGNYTQGR